MKLFKTFDNLFTEEECKELSDFYFNKKKNKEVVRDDQSGPLASVRQMAGKITEPALQRAADKAKEVLSERLKKDLRFTYIHIREYQRGSILEWHVDNGLHQHTMDVCIAKANPDTVWPLYVSTPDDAQIETIEMDIGSGYHFEGCENPHWRNKLEDDWQLQLFIHFIDADGRHVETADVLEKRKDSSTFIADEAIKPWPLTRYTWNQYAVIPSAFNLDECMGIIREGKAGIRTTHLRKGKTDGDKIGVHDLSVRDSEVSFFITDNPRNVPLFSKITEIIVNANLNFFNYDIYDLEALQFTTYSAGYNGFYSKHVDTHAVSSATNVRKLSFSLQLSNPDSYEGGDLLLWAENEPIVAPKNRGDLIIFPSYVMHEVTPVTRGLRSSLVGWVTGPAWK